MSQKQKAPKRGGFLRNFFNLLFRGGNHVVYASPLEEEQMRSPMRTMVANFFGKRLAVTGLVLILLVMVLCFSLSAIFPLNLYYQDVTQQNVAPGFHLMSMPAALQKDLACMDTGATFGIGADSKGKAYMWGHLPGKLGKIPKEAADIVMVSAGSDHVLALTREGKVVTWGNKRFKLDQIPKEVKNAPGIKQLGAGDQFSLALTTEGKLYFWGNGNLISMSQSAIGKDVQGHIEEISVNADNVLLLMDDSTLRVLGIKATPMHNVPAVVQGHVVDIATSKDATIALTDDGKVYAWGNDKYGLLAVPETLQGRTARIEAGRNHFIAITTDGKAVAWGDNMHGQSDVPEAVGLSGAHQVVRLYSDYYQNYAFDETGALHSWGLRGYLMGTDGYGRDIFRRLVAGGRMTLTVGAVAVLISMVIGVLIGGLAGFYGGKVDDLLMRFAEIMGAIPFLPFAMTLSAVIGNNVSET
ncbi:MAG: peptide ABC transporter permease, partial [Clostridia bacterium]